METGPSALIEAIVGWLVPPASREHVLGDLRERAATTREYVAHAIDVVPAVIFSRLRRTFDGAAWLTRPAMGTLAIGGFLMLIPVRVSWDLLFRADGYRPLAMGSLVRDAMDADAWRRALETRRDLLRTSWLLYLAPLVVLGYLPPLFRPAPRVWVVIAEASITAAALLILHAITRRMADLLQRDINDLQSGE